MVPRIAGLIIAGTACIGCADLTCKPLDDSANSVCDGDVNWAKNWGKWQDRAAVWYKNMPAYTGVNYTTGTLDDFHRFFWCWGRVDGEPRGCGAPPCQCSKPPCNQCTASTPAVQTLEEALLHFPAETTEIRLPSRYLTGTIPDSLPVKFKHLTVLDLSSNNLEGPIPESLGMASGLVHLDLSYNNMEGSLPSSVGNWTKLKFIKLRSSGFSGPIPAAVGSWTQLETCWMSYSDFTGSLPPEMGEWSKVKVVYFSENQFTGSIPKELGRWTHVQKVQFGANKLSGTIPRELGKWTYVRDVRFNDNNLSGAIPFELGKWTNVREVRFNGNRLSGALPPELAEWTSVEVAAFSNNQLGGSIPKELGDWRNVKEVYFSHNHLSGNIPGELGKWTNVRKVYFYHNHLSGAIPPALRAWTKVTAVNLGMNDFTGVIPPELGEWTEVTYVSLNWNDLCGSIPKELGKWRHITSADLQGNELNGSIPSELGNWGEASTVQIQFNRLTGNIPPELGNWRKLKKLYLQENFLTGSIPSVVGNWRDMEILHLGENQLTGSLPVEMGNCKIVWFIDMEFNQITGSIPKEFGSMTRLTAFRMEMNRLSGSIPDELRGWTNIHDVYLNDNQLTGSIPSALGSWSKLEQLTLARNTLSGEVPSGIFTWSKVTTVDFSWNQLTGDFPPDVSNLHSLEDLNLEGNHFQSLPDMTQLHSLTYFNANKNAIHTVGEFPLSLVHLDLGYNQLSEVPKATYPLKDLEVLRMPGNKITTWPLKGVTLERISTGVLRCEGGQVEDRFVWTKLRKLDVSHNHMDTQARHFLDSLGYLQALTELHCRNCTLDHPLVIQHRPGLADDQPDESCESVRVGFTSLINLDLADNRITLVEAEPSPALMFADLSGNVLSELNQAWFNEEGSNGIVNLKIFGNTKLQKPVMQPVGRCGNSGVTALATDPDGYLHLAGSGYECSSLCRGPLTTYLHDVQLNVSSLCRCRVGFEGAGASCTICPKDTYSFSADPFQLVRECRPCPGGAFTEEPGQGDISACKCPVGTYLNLTAGHCQHCQQWPFRTTQDAGSVHASACGCNSRYVGLKEAGGFCGCDDEWHMNHKVKACEKCSNSEQCFWSTRLDRSIAPPKVKAGFWAEPVQNPQDFARNEIWRCTNEMTCLVNGTCAEGREGRACSLCQPGMYGGQDGPCEPCGEDSTPEGRRWMLASSVLFLVPVVVLLHVGLTDGGDGLGFVLQLRAIKGSMKQTVKHLQTVTVIGGLSVSWPPIAKTFFDTLKRLTIRVPTFLAVGCLQDQQSASLEMGFKWAMPGIFVTATILAMPASWVMAKAVKLMSRRCAGTALARKLPSSDGLTMHLPDVARVLLFSITLFWSTLVANSLEILTCIPAPNGKLTVATYPHLVCSSSDPEFMKLSLIAAMTIVLYVLLPLRVLHRAYHKSRQELVASDCQERGWFGFIFDDFRDDHLIWTLIIMAKDALFVMIPVFLPGQGAFQLLLTAAFCSLHTCLVVQGTPFKDRSNSLLEAWNGATSAALCFYSTGMGYESTAGMENIAELFQDGTDDPTYKGRALGMVIVQFIAIGVPAVVMLYQLLCAVERTRRMLPQRVRPASEEECQSWLANFKESTSGCSDMASIIDKFDDADLYAFRSLFEQTTALVGHKLSHNSQSHLVRMTRLQREMAIDSDKSYCVDSEKSYAEKDDVESPASDQGAAETAEEKHGEASSGSTCQGLCETDEKQESHGERDDIECPPDDKHTIEI